MIWQINQNIRYGWTMSVMSTSKCKECQHVTLSFNFDNSSINVLVPITDTHRSGISPTHPVKCIQQEAKSL